MTKGRDVGWADTRQIGGEEGTLTAPGYAWYCPWPGFIVCQ